MIGDCSDNYGLNQVEMQVCEPKRHTNSNGGYNDGGRRGK